MKILVLSEVQPKRYGTLWEAIAAEHDVDIRCYGDTSLRKTLSAIDLTSYDKVVLASGVRRLGKQALELANIPELFIFDLDLQQDFMEESKYHESFPCIFRTIEKVRLIVTSLASLEHYQEKGFSVSYLPKAYDHRLIKDLEQPRDIEFGFIGRTNNRIYARRREMLNKISSHFPVQILRTADASKENNEYNALLNRIKFFISADAGFQEFHIKNFEAMAAGCIVCAIRTSTQEEKALGFRDMENIVLYDTDIELKQKIEALRQSPERMSAISKSGRELAVERHSWVNRKQEMLSALEAGVESSGTRSFQERCKMLALRMYWLV